MKTYVYKIYFPTSNKCYIGQTNNLNKRMKEHLENKSFIGNALRKYDDWQISILHTRKDRDAANLIEIEEIRNFNSIVPNGYNLTRGGEGGIGWQKGRKHSKETIEKISISHLGKCHSKNTRKKMSEAKIGKKNPNAHSTQSEIRRLKTRLAKLEKE